MKKLLTVLLFLFSSVAFAASNSNPGFYYGQQPTPAQWNSYFSGKLDYAPGSANSIPYWDGSGNLLNAVVSGDCTAVANFFTCPLTSTLASPTPIGSVTPNTGAFTTLKQGSGTTGWVFIPYPSGSTYSGIYQSSVTPSTLNYTIVSSGADTSVGGTTSSELAVNGINVWSCLSTGCTGIIGATSPSTGTFTDIKVGGTALMSGQGVFHANSSYGEVQQVITGSLYDYAMVTPSGLAQIVGVPTGTSTFSVLNSLALGGKLLASATAPTIASGFGTSPSIVSSNGTATFRVNVGTGGTASAGIVTLPSGASTGWACSVYPQSIQAGAVTLSTSYSLTSIQLTNYTLSTGSALPWTSGEVLFVQCVGF